MQNLQSLTENQIISNSIQSYAKESANMMLHIETDQLDNMIGDQDIVPPIPQKTKRRSDRQPSPYDNVPDNHYGK